MTFNMQSRNKMPEKLEDEFNKPVESIMRCEDFKSNFARRLSNRYKSSSSISQPKQDTGLKLRPPENGDSENVSHNAPGSFEQSSLLYKTTNMEENGDAVKPPDKTPFFNSDIKRTEVNAINMEVETLRWQLAQTEANRQMHIALLKQIVTFLNKVKDHFKQQNNETGIRKDVLPTRLLPRSFNTADLPRSRSVVHVNKSLEYIHSTTKKINTKKISKSISNVNGFKDYNNMCRSQSKLSLEPEKDTNQKISEEMTRLITLANTVLSTKIPDLACSCNDTESNLSALTNQNTGDVFNESNVTALSQIKEDPTNVFKGNYNFMSIKEQSNDLKLSFSSLTGLEMEKSFFEIKSPEEKRSDISIEGQSAVFDDRNTISSAEKRNNLISSFIEDESGFSSMSSFQEIGIPIISIIPPSPSKEIGFLEGIPDLIDDVEKWKTDHIELEKQTMKVFWV